MAKRIVLMGCLGLALMLVCQDEAEAQRRAGGSRVRTGTVVRSGPKGTSNGTFRTQVQNDRADRTRTVIRDGQATTPRGERGVQSSNTIQGTGQGSYDREWSRTTTDPNGKSRTWTGEGSGNVDRTENGLTRTYEGTTTAPNGQEYTVNKTAETVKTETGFERDATRTVTDSSGNVIGTGESHTTGVRGEGTTTTGSWTGRQGTSTYQGQSQRGEDGVDHTWMLTGPNGRTGSGESHWDADLEPVEDER
jgi:hypothetical protein